MKRITVTQVLTIASGVIAINQDQYRRRSHNLELIGGDNKEQLVLDEDIVDMIMEAECAPCRVVKPVMFKVGEVLFLDEVPKSMHPSFMTDDDIEAAEKEAAAAQERVDEARKKAEEKEEAERIEKEEKAEAARLATEKATSDAAEKAEQELKVVWDALSDKQRAEHGDDFESYKEKLAEAKEPAVKKAPKKKAPNKKK